jgi:hypothetical protein
MVSTEVRCPVCSHPERVEWFWPRRVPKGKITVLGGDPDNGKSVLTTDLAARKTVGKNLPDGTPTEAGGSRGGTAA